MSTKNKFAGFYWVVGFLLTLNQTWAQPYGLDTRASVGPFLNIKMPPAAQGSVGGWTTIEAFPNLTFEDPVFLTFEPRSSRLYVCGRQGTIHFFQNSATVSSKTLFLDLSAKTQGFNDCGLLGLAFHPEFGRSGSPNRRYFYVYYQFSPSPTPGPATVPSTLVSYNRLSRFTVKTDGTADPASEQVLINQYDRHLWHNGAALFFGPDGFLYVVNGDEGGANDNYNQTQKLNDGLFSGVLRIDVNRSSTKSHPIRRQPQNPATPPAGWPDSFSANYYIPNDNPFLDPAGGLLEEFWAIGLRSPHRMTYDALTKRTWLGDVGQGAWEEINVIEKGGNYQWPYREGLHTGPKAKPSPLIGTDKPPIYEYYHQDGNACIVMGYVYRGTQFATDLGGKLLFGDNVSGRIWTLSYDGANPPVVTLLCNMPSGSSGYTGLSSFGIDRDGEIYLCKMGRSPTPGKIYKLGRTGTQPPPPPALLSQTGAFADTAGLVPTAGVIPFVVNSPLWSDNAFKQRWIALPNDGSPYGANEAASFAPTAEWSFPNGTVFVKHFELPVDDTDPNIRRRLETRLLVRDTNGAVYGVTYKWRSDNSDADLLSTSLSEDIPINTGTGSRVQTWYYPSQQDCLVCHNANAKFVLGVNTRQLNCNLSYPSTGLTDNQLRTWNHLGMLNPPILESSIGSYAKLVAMNDTSASSEQRVRSYLDANCAQCHRPNSITQANFDARYTTPLANQGIVDGTVNDDLDIVGAKEVAPGSLSQSVMYLRMNSVDQIRMPPLARNVIDTQAVGVLANWINTLTPGLPGTASSPSPFDDAPNVNPTVTLSWLPGTGATSHKVYLGISPSLGGGDLKSTQTGTTYTPPTLAFATTYYWRVDEVNAQGTTTGVVWKFTTAPNLSLPRVTTSKPVYSPGESIVVTFQNASGNSQDWIGLFNSGAANTAYLTWRYTSGTQSGVPGLINGSVNFITGLSATGNYEARFFFNDSYTLQASVAFSVQSGGGPPGIAGSPSPASGATGVGTTPTLSWTAGAGATSHKVYFGTNPNPGSAELRSTQSATSYNTGTLATGTVYYWRIDEVNAQGTTTGPIWSFTTQSAPLPPGAATSPSPINGASGVSTSPNLSWTSGSGATSHKVYFGTNPSLGAAELKATQTTTSYSPGALASSTTYYWRIDEVNAQGTTPGPVWSFTTSVPGTSPQVTTSKASYSPGEPIVVNFFNASGDSQDWAGIYTVGAPNTVPLAWNYTSGTKSGVPGLHNGTITFTSGLPTQGNYEARLFFNDSYTMQASVSFAVLSGAGFPAPASGPNPANGASGLTTATTLSWTAGSGATSHKVYLGTSPSLGAPDLKSTQTATAYTPPGLVNATAYYWRIDEVNAQGTTPGVVWNFSTVGLGTDPRVTTSAPTYSPGGAIVVNFFNASGNPQDWIGLYASGAQNSDFLAWRYTSGTQTGVPGWVNGSVGFSTGISTPGNYQARLFFNDTFTLEASVGFTVQSGAAPQRVAARPGGSTRTESARILNLWREAQHAYLEVRGPTGRRILLQSSEDLEHWLDVASARAVEGTLILEDSNSAENRQRFFRLVVLTE